MRRALWILVFVCLAGTQSVLRGETILLKNGEKLEGRILRRDADSLRVELADGTRTIALADIDKILDSDDGSSSPADGTADEADSGPAAIDAEAFEAAYAALSIGDAAGYHELGQRAASSGLDAAAARAYRAALRVHPDHPGARAALGFLPFAGGWITADQARTERQLEYRDGGWVSLNDPKAAPKAAKLEPKAGPAAKPEAPAVDPSDPNAWYDDHTTICGWDEAPIKKTKRYLIRSNIKSEYVDRYGLMMDQYFERFLSVFKKLILPGTRYSRSVITIYAEQKAFMDNEKVPKSVGGFYRPSNRLVVGYHGRFGKTGTTRTVLAHEGTHQFQHLVLGQGFVNCPIWLIEGLAVLFESADWNPTKKKIELGNIPKDRMEVMKRAVKEGKTIPLTDLFRVPRNKFTGFHYAHAWAVIYRLIYGTKAEKQRKQNARILSELFSMGRQRRVRNRDVIKAFGGDASLAKFEEDWKQWITETPLDFRPR